MSIPHKLLALIAISMLNLVSVNTNAADYSIKQIDSQTLSYQGRISEGSSQELRSKFNTDIRHLRITSQGGSAREAMLLGRFLSENNITLIVDQYCIEACANYLFLGAKTKMLEPGSLLGFQNTLRLQNFAELKHKFDKQEISSRDFNTSTSQVNAPEQLQILEWEYLQSLQLESNTLTRIYQKMMEGINANKNISVQMRKPAAPISSSFYEEVAEPNPIDRKLQAAMSRKSYSLKTDKNGTGIVYFPHADFLITLGITGINAYPYPDSDLALNALFHKDLDNVKTIAYFNRNILQTPETH